MPDPKRPGGPPSRDRSNTRRGHSSPIESTFDDDQPTQMDVLRVSDPDVSLRPVEASVPRPRGAYPPAPPVPRMRTEPPPPLPATIEIEAVHESGPMQHKRGVWRALEIWTKNRIYSLDSGMTCIEVIDRDSGRPDREHTFVGGRLGGGQRREGQHLRLSHPFPVPGTEAVFKLPSGRRGRFGQTSKVERVVLRIRLATVPMLDAEPLWDEITGPVSIPPPTGPGRSSR